MFDSIGKRPKTRPTSPLFPSRSGRKACGSKKTAQQVSFPNPCESRMKHIIAIFTFLLGLCFFMCIPCQDARAASPESEADWIYNFVRQMTAHYRMGIGSAAILVPAKRAGTRIAGQLTKLGLRAEYSTSGSLDISTNTVKVLTIHTSKGMEFPFVVLAGFEEGTYPTPDNYDNHEVYLEQFRNSRRLLYVGMTRAINALMLIIPEDCRHEALCGLDEDNWGVME